MDARLHRHDDLFEFFRANYRANFIAEICASGLFLGSSLAR